ncbi:hypothetical protein A2118_03080 [Candidatus Kaiserbacteria bacterium GWA2_50_9]|uniref:EfeO-type cupredoxin-like domain-containing protein n=1 Tax=Candidatus Kaiserbacteria bacterium GWA2_50_9 TaxID=1798474 RepID=A0A1F6BWA9_9BACT|nr:MAG: hypothetical protein A2118_03080 [Candidatus Kaiserbacteria bacterium GWA2_50_9]
MRNPIGAIVVLVVIIAGGWYLLKGKPAEAPAPDATITGQMPADDSSVPETVVKDGLPTDVIVEYTDAGFSPASVTVPLGTYIVFVNQSSKNMWVASAMHPTHTAYSGTTLAQHCPDTTGTAFDECKGDAPGSSYSFKFNKAGEWKYHDHIDATKFGTIIVTPATTS